MPSSSCRSAAFPEFPPGPASRSRARSAPSRPASSASRSTASSSRPRASVIVEFDDYDAWHSWREIADSGFIRNHDPSGDTLYGIEIMVDPECRGLRLSRRLYEARKELARQHNLQRIIIGGRIPGYAAHADQMSAREYVDRVIAKELYDPVLTAQISNGFALQGLIPNYLPADAGVARLRHLPRVAKPRVPRDPASPLPRGGDAAPEPRPVPDAAGCLLRGVRDPVRVLRRRGGRLQLRLRALSGALHHAAALARDASRGPGWRPAGWRSSRRSTWS